MGVPQNRWFIRENPIEMDDLGVPPFMENPIYPMMFQRCRPYFSGFSDYISWFSHDIPWFFSYDVPCLEFPMNSQFVFSTYPILSIFFQWYPMISQIFLVFSHWFSQWFPIILPPFPISLDDDPSSFPPVVVLMSFPSGFPSSSSFWAPRMFSRFSDFPKFFFFRTQLN